MDNEVDIQVGGLSDLNDVYTLVKELAKYEKAENEVISSPEEYIELFEQGLFRCLTARYNGKTVGMMVFFDAFSTWKGKMLWLEDFIVLEDFRRLGVGKKMFEELIALAKKENYRLIKWEVLDWNEPAIQFYKKMGAKLETNWWDGKYFLTDL